MTGLGFTPLNENSPWHFRVPSFRFDCEQEVDLIEECARVYGFDNIQSQPLSSSPFMKSIDPLVERTQVVLPILNTLGYSEAITYSFVDPHSQSELLGEGSSAIQLKNPISQDLSVMRLSCWPGLLKLLQYNLNRQHHRVRVFEIGRVFADSSQSNQHTMLTMLAFGPIHGTSWCNSADQKMSDFYSVKGDVEGIIHCLNLRDKPDWQAGQHAMLHPGQCAHLSVGDCVVGTLGALHPKLVSSMGLPAVPFLFELNFDLLNDSVVPQFKSLSRYPGNEARFGSRG